MVSSSCSNAFGSELRIVSIGCGVRMPATTSSPWAFARNSPYSPVAPVDGSRVNATPVPERSPLLPKTICTTLTAVPRSSAISCARRYTWARGLSHDAKTARTARSSWSRAPVGKSVPVSSR